jgi:hypothetical protein
MLMGMLDSLLNLVQSLVGRMDSHIGLPGNGLKDVQDLADECLGVAGIVIELFRVAAYCDAAVVRKHLFEVGARVRGVGG